jgi:predicted DNA-binding transcriptional regulator YafY
MSILKYLDRIKQMDELIRRKATGSPDEFAEKVGLSRSALMKYIKLLKEMNVPLEYDQNQ